MSAGAASTSYRTSSVTGSVAPGGRYEGPARSDIEQSFEESLARLFASAQTPRLSGVRIKSPMFLDSKGLLVPCTTEPFTHILKPAGPSGLQALPIIEYLSMTLGLVAGIEAPAIADRHAGRDATGADRRAL